MSGEESIVARTWYRWLDWGRVVLAGACLGLQWLNEAPAFRTAAAGVYLALALGLAARRDRGRTGPVTAAPLADTAAFLICLDASGPAGFVLAACWYSYLQGYALVRGMRHQILAVGGMTAAYVGLARPAEWLALLLLSAGVAAVALLGDRQRRRIEERYNTVSRQAAMLRSEAEAACNRERERIAGDFHDGPLQAFLNVQMRLEVLRRLLATDREAGLKELVQLQKLFQSQVAETRAFLRSMRHGEVEGAELAASLSRLAAAFQKDTGLSVTFTGTATLGDQQGERAAEVVQLVRESLNNVRKHAKATAVVVTLGQTDGRLQVSIEDNGSGFPFAGIFSLEELDLLRLGPASIKRRVRALGGGMSLDSMPGRGSGLRIWIPQ